jgi:anthranilate synthase/aminodeoxychorismate synthase-like glutamine amidotransferase
MKVLFIDNYGLFTYNLVDEFEKKDCEVLVYGNDADMKVIGNAVKKFRPKLIVISPGPENIDDSGNSVDVIRVYQGQIPIFGVGSGCECIIWAFEGKVSRTPVINHGRITKINHDGKTIFKKMDNPFIAGLYNSLSASDVPYSLEVSARSENDIVMGVRHKECFVEGIQFHPESLLTAQGSLIISNLIKEVGKK